MSESSGAPLVTSVVLNWRKPEMTATCVQRLLASAYPRHDIVIVDNGSGDGSFEQLAERFPNLVVIKSPQNVGFSRGCNLGLRHAIEQGAQYVGLVNNDLILEPTSLPAAIASLESHPEYGAVTGKIYSAEPGVIWQAGGYVSHVRIMGVARGKNEQDTGQYDTPGTTRWASGAMTTFRASALERIGLLPEDYFFGQEEWDMSTALLQLGYKIGFVPEYVGHHSQGSSYAPHPALNSYGSARNRHLYAERYLNSMAYRAWRIAFWAHLRFIMLPKLLIGRTHVDPSIHTRAMLLGWERHEHGKAVTLEELREVSAELGISDSWAPPQP